jgi:hypothetical protein
VRKFFGLILFSLAFFSGTTVLAQNNIPVAPGMLPGVTPQAACYQTYAGTQGAFVFVPCTTANLQTTVNCSTSGTAIFAMVSQNPNNKRVLIQLNACLGTASYTYPTVFTVTPSIYASNNVAASVITANTTTAMTVTGATTTGSIYTEAY